MYHRTAHQTRRTGRLRRAVVVLATAGVVAVSLASVAVPGAAAKPAKRPDLQVGKLGTTPATVKYGATFNLGAVVVNRGRTAAKASKLRVYLSRDKKAGKGDVTGATVKVKRIPARKRKTVSGTVRVPVDARGTYWVIACADAGKKVKESKEGNNCRVSKTPLTIDASIKAELSGTLTFGDRGQTDDGAGRTESWDRSIKVNVAVGVSGDPSTRTQFTNSGSTYERNGSRTTRTTSATCIDEIVRSEAGTGWLSDYQASINGHFTRTDLGGVRVSMAVPATWTRSETRTPQGPNGCDTYGTTTTGKDIITHSVELKEVSTTASAITYEVVGWTGDMSLPSEFETLTGRLVLQLK